MPPKTDAPENDQEPARQHGPATDQGDDSSTQDGNKLTGEPTSDAGDEKQITMTPQQLQDRLARAKPSDYDDLKAKAARFDELEEQNKTDLQKAQERAEAAERDRDLERTAGLRWRIAARFGVSDDDAELFLTGTDEDTLTRQAERLQARQPQQQQVGLRIDHSGQTSAAPSRDDAAREFFGL